MVVYTHFSLVVLSFLSYALPTQSKGWSNLQPKVRTPKTRSNFVSGTTRHGIKWLEPERSALVCLNTPDLPLWNQAEHIGEDIPNNLIFKFMISHDNRTLLVQDEPFLPLPNPYVPPRLNAPQTSLSIEQFQYDTLPDLSRSAFFALDYERLVRPRDDWSKDYKSYNPEISFDLLGAGIEGHNALLSFKSQWIIKLQLKDHNTLHKSTANRPNHNFTISDIWLQERDEHYHFPNIDILQRCTLWSWRCEDIRDAPWYRFVFRQDFDEYGKIGSLRHEVLKRWSTLSGKVSGIALVVVGAMVVWALCYTLYLLGKQVRAYPEIGRRTKTAQVEGEGGEYGYVLVEDMNNEEDDLDSDGETNEEVLQEKQQNDQDHESVPTASVQSRSRYKNYRVSK